MSVVTLDPPVHAPETPSETPLRKRLQAARTFLANGYTSGCYLDTNTCGEPPRCCAVGATALALDYSGVDNGLVRDAVLADPRGPETLDALDKAARTLIEAIPPVEAPRKSELRILLEHARAWYEQGYSNTRYVEQRSDGGYACCAVGGVSLALGNRADTLIRRYVHARPSGRNALAALDAAACELYPQKFQPHGWGYAIEQVSQHEGREAGLACYDLAISRA